MASLSTCHLGLWLGWQILLNLVKSQVYGQYCVAYVLLRRNGIPVRTFVIIFGTDLMITIAEYLIVLNSCDRVDCTIVYNTSIEPFARWTHP